MWILAWIWMAYSMLHDAIRLIRELEKYDLHFAEQPVSKLDIRGFVEVRRKVNVPIVRRRKRMEYRRGSQFD